MVIAICITVLSSDQFNYILISHCLLPWDVQCLECADNKLRIAVSHEISYGHLPVSGSNFLTANHFTINDTVTGTVINGPSSTSNRICFIAASLLCFTKSFKIVFPLSSLKFLCHFSRKIKWTVQFSSQPHTSISWGEYVPIHVCSNHAYTGA